MDKELDLKLAETALDWGIELAFDHHESVFEELLKKYEGDEYWLKLERAKDTIEEIWEAGKKYLNTIQKITTETTERDWNIRSQSEWNRAMDEIFNLCQQVFISCGSDTSTIWKDMCENSKINYEIIGKIQKITEGFVLD
jgi:ribosome-binding ATPase YchF (GTP1/OBG family)